MIKNNIILLISTSYFLFSFYLQAGPPAIGFKSKLSLEEKKILEISEKRRSTAMKEYENNNDMIVNLQKKIENLKIEIYNIEEQIQNLKDSLS
tara:strand:- start:44 stop:322 length:279 start_codon:yes stop_codon:yes gene_type:complete